MFAGPAGGDDEAAAIPLELERGVDGEGLVAAKIDLTGAGASGAKANAREPS
jgi:hypothetical protein